MSQRQTVQAVQPIAQEPGAAAIHIVRHSPLTATVASAADGLFSAFTDLVFGHSIGRKRSRSASGATDAVSNGIMMTGPADACNPTAQPAIKRYHTAPAPLTSTPTTEAGTSFAAQARHNHISAPTRVETIPIASSTTLATPVHKQQSQHLATTDQQSLPVIRTTRGATTTSADVVTTPTTPEAKAAAGLLQLAATPVATTSAKSSKGKAARLCKATVAVAPCLPTASAEPVESSQAVGISGPPASITTWADLRPNDRIRVQIPCKYTKQDGTKSKSSWYHQFDATIASIDVETGTVSLDHVTVATNNIRIADPLVQAHCESIATRQLFLRREVGLVNRAGAWEPL